MTETLRDVLVLHALVAEIPHDEDLSYWDRPSIADHPQNHNFLSWTYLLSVVRDLYAALASANQTDANVLLAYWRTLGFPAFKRLMLHSTTQDKRADISICAQLLIEDANALWHVSVQRECLRFFAKVANASPTNKQTLSSMQYSRAHPARCLSMK